MKPNKIWDQFDIMRVNELAKTVGVTPDTVRFYTRVGLLQPAKSPANGYKLYGNTEKKRLIFIVKARHLGFSVSEIQEVFDLSGQGSSPCCRVREIVKKRLQEARERIAELEKLTGRMELAVASWEAMPDSEPTGESVCGLIEMWEDSELPLSETL
ncbi:MAG: MerR family DNA-binding protein [Pseudomonadales bacterium]|nr:MerR family DNA-binding protein [Pseudomonadales bacterium]